MNYTTDIALAAQKAVEIREQSLSTSSHQYLMTLEEACIRACEEVEVDPDIARLISLALDTWQNDVLAWAEEILHGSPVIRPSSFLVQSERASQAPIERSSREPTQEHPEEIALLTKAANNLEAAATSIRYIISNGGLPRP